MSYEKHTWETGEVITADKLNHIEGGIGDAGPGYEYQYTKSILDEETVTTEYQESSILTYHSLISADELVVTIDGAEYIVEKEVRNGVNGYGDFDENGEPIFTKYPFALFSIPQTEGADNYITIENDGTYSIKIESRELEVTNNREFNEAVVNGAVLVVGLSMIDSSHFTLDKIWQEIYDALDSGRLVLIKSKFSTSSSTGISHAQIHTCQYDSNQNAYQVYFGSQGASASSSSPDGVLSGYYGG